MYKKLMLLIIVISFCIAWSNNPKVNTPICTGPGRQECARIVSDCAGGAIIIWSEYQPSQRDIYAQRIDSNGNIQWETEGVHIMDLGYPMAVSDRSGGAFILGTDRYNLYAQHINSDGIIQWDANGIHIYHLGNNNGNMGEVDLIYDGSGGIIITWDARFDFMVTDIFAQRVDSEGSVKWTANGVPICTAEDTQSSPDITGDGSGGAIISWHDYRMGNVSSMDIYAQRINSNGVVQWTENGVVVVAAEDNQLDNKIVSDGSGGAIITWKDYRNDTGDIFAQRIDATGTVQWQAGGAAICTAVDTQHTPDIVTDGSGGAIITWHDNRSDGPDIYAQRINQSGTIQWPIDGLPVCSAEGSQGWPEIAYDGSGAIIAWNDHRDSESEDIYAQRINLSGTPQWETNGVPVSTAKSSKSSQGLQVDGKGGAIFTWVDFRNQGSQGDIYAQNICADGKLGDCSQPVAAIDADRFGGIAPVTIHFDGSNSINPGGDIVTWKWNFGDGSTASGEKVSHTYNNPGTYTVSLRVKNSSGRWSENAEKKVQLFSPGALQTEIEFDAQVIKANGKGVANISAACYEKSANTNKKLSFFTGKYERPGTSLMNLAGDPVKLNLGLTFSTTTGTLQDEVCFNSENGCYSQDIISGPVGTGKVSAVVDDYVLATGTVTFAWPQPPVNLKVELKENRSLLRGEYYAYLSWSANPEEVFTAAKYRIYRSSNGGAFKLAAEVDATAFSYVDASLPTGSQYIYAVAMVDTAGDESGLSSPIAAHKK